MSANIAANQTITRMQMTDPSLSDQHTLSIRLSEDGFSFAIYPHLADGEPLFRTFHVNPQHSLAANVKEFLTRAEELKLSHGQTNILIHTPRYTPVPFELYEDDQSETLFYQNLPKRNNEVILCNILSKSNVAILFSIDKLTHQLLSDQFPKARFFVSISPITEYLTLRNRQDADENEMFAVRHPEQIDILVFKRHRLTLVNSYQAPNDSDKNYYLLDVWKQLEMDRQADRLLFCGSRPQEEQISFLSTYLKNISTITPRTEFRNTPMSRIPEVPFDILSLISCE